MIHALRAVLQVVRLFPRQFFGLLIMSSTAALETETEPWLEMTAKQGKGVQVSHYVAHVSV